MPGKYSHTVVLATYSSRGIFNVPSSQRSNPERDDLSGTSYSPFLKSRNGESPPAKKTSATTPSQSTPDHPRRHPRKDSSRKSTQPSNNTSSHTPRDSHNHPSGVAAQTHGVSSHGQESRPRQAEAGIESSSKPEYGLSRYSHYESDPWFIPSRQSHQIGTDAAERAIADPSEPYAMPQHRHVRKYEPRPDVSERRGLMPRSRHYRSAKAEKHVEPLLSLQQFLDLLPPRDGSSSQLDRTPPQSVFLSSSKRVTLLPGFRPAPPRCDSAPALHRRSSHLDSARPPPRTANSSDSFNRGDTSFIDSSDDSEEGEEVTGFEKLHAAHMPPSTPAGHDDFQPPFSGYHEDANSRRKIVDLTKDLRELPAMYSPRPENGANSPPVTVTKVHQMQSERSSLYPYESDVSEDFPLQKHSPPPQLRSATFQAAHLTRSQTPIYELPDNQVERIVDGLRKGPLSSDPKTQKLNVAAEERLPPLPEFSDIDDFEENPNTPSVIDPPHGRQRYYRTKGEETTKSESRISISRLTSRKSFDIGRRASLSSAIYAQGRTPSRIAGTPEPLHCDMSISSATDIPEVAPLRIRSKTPPVPTRDSRRVTSPTACPGPTIPFRPVNPTPNFGTLSVVRNPDEKTMLKVQNVSRSTTPLPAEGKASPQKFPLLQRHLLHSFSDLASMKSINVPELTRRSSYESLVSPERKGMSPEAKTPSTADFADDSWGRLSIEPARSTRRVAEFESQPAQSHDNVEKRGRSNDINHQRGPVALPPPDIYRHRPGEVQRGAVAVGGRNQSKGVFGRFIRW
ncbi:hypothetical protein PV08_11918 [Exophiala spinifera]|uniref:Uncharacterized protein n=1 Tax=Exophiala spinifera TaxID=91928 RepID=A0A0D1Z9X2_9EURO|nr:uncharacterized protein PV08_11918 [Exophiala spinifera]KIW09817.1 hypothetical protein PV08_11918 [Exophiala spinifera]